MNNINITLEESINSFLGLEKDNESDSDESTTEDTESEYESIEEYNT